jgi:hypothetical protein
VFGKKLHTDDDTSGSIDTQLFPLYVTQDENTVLKYPRLRYIPQWTSWADTTLEAIEVGGGDLFYALSQLLFIFYF